MRMAIYSGRDCPNPGCYEVHPLSIRAVKFVPPFSPMYDAGDAKLYHEPQTIKDFQNPILEQHLVYERLVEDHNATLSSPLLSLNLGDAFSLL
ncbi:unnamed protein product [Cuscuta campestris]|uniref:Uncharacterized protein n=1 Tax=Cuscuta campestris TaxID=132261 RepID=A0A484M8A2_9ASTE|nr:unnamed protein product [Cuscuta campestris]